MICKFAFLLDWDTLQLISNQIFSCWLLTFSITWTAVNTQQFTHQFLNEKFNLKSLFTNHLKYEHSVWLRPQQLIFISIFHFRLENRLDFKSNCERENIMFRIYWHVPTVNISQHSHSHNVSFMRENFVA